MLGEEQKRRGPLILEVDLGSFGDVMTELEQEKAVWELEKASLIERNAKEVERLKKSRSHKVTQERVRVQLAMNTKSNRLFANIQEREAQRGPYDSKCFLYTQASGMRKCLEKVRENGVATPQVVINIFATRETQYEQEVKEL